MVLPPGGGVNPRENAEIRFSKDFGVVGHLARRGRWRSKVQRRRISRAPLMVSSAACGFFVASKPTAGAQQRPDRGLRNNARSVPCI